MLTNLSKITLVAVCLLSSVLAANAQKVSKEFKEVPLKTVLEEIEAQTGYSFVFENSEIGADRPITAEFTDTPLRNVLDRILAPNLQYSIDGKLVTISRRKQGQAAPQKKTVVRGTVISALDNMPIIGAAVLIDNQTQGAAVTDIDGNYVIEIPAGASEVYFSCRP